ncbi:MAG: lysophospholipid acyltransferase family protein [Bacteroidia bacterium]
MEIIRLILSPFWKIIFLLHFAISFLVFYPFLLVFLSKRKWYKYAFVCQKIIARWICWGSLIFVKRYARTDLSTLPQPCVIVANHASYLDIVISYLFLKKYYVFMAKIELNKAPLFNIFFKDMQIAVDRKSRVGSHKAFVRAAEEIDAGHSVFIFPEGTLSSEGTLKPFKNGPFKLAIDKQVPLVVITYLNNWKILQNGGFFKSYGKPGIARVVIHPVISTVGMTDENLVSLRQQVYDLTQNTLNELK